MPLRILYCALDQRVPGTLGGSVHVEAVAHGLAALGHEVHALVTPGPAVPPRGVHWHALPAPGGRAHLRLLRAPAVRRIARDVRPHIAGDAPYGRRSQQAQVRAAAWRGQRMPVHAAGRDGRPWCHKRVHLMAECRQPVRDRLDVHRAAERARHTLVERAVEDAKRHRASLASRAWPSRSGDVTDSRTSSNQEMAVKPGRTEVRPYGSAAAGSYGWPN